MPKRRSEEERIVNWFQTADASAASTMLRVVQGILKAKNGPLDASKPRSRRRHQVTVVPNPKLGQTEPSLPLADIGASVGRP